MLHFEEKQHHFRKKQLGIRTRYYRVTRWSRVSGHSHQVSSDPLIVAPEKHLWNDPSRSLHPNRVFLSRCLGRLELRPFCQLLFLDPRSLSNRRTLLRSRKYRTFAFLTISVGRSTSDNSGYRFQRLWCGKPKVCRRNPLFSTPSRKNGYLVPDSTIVKVTMEQSTRI